MSLEITGIAHVKLPVTDLARSVAWYRALLDLEPAFEFVENGVLRGAALVDPTGGIRIALRDRSVCPSRPVLAGFDPVAFTVPTAEALQQVAERCDRLGFRYVRHERGKGAGIDVPDPDGTHIRFIHDPEDFPDFLGLEFDDTGLAGTYDRPRLAD